jgi:hypothetical protein
LKIFDVFEKSCTKSFKICEFNLSSIVMLKADEVFAVIILLARLVHGITIFISSMLYMAVNQSLTLPMITPSLIWFIFLKERLLFLLLGTAQSSSSVMLAAFLIIFNTSMIMTTKFLRSQSISKKTLYLSEILKVMFFV